MIRRTKIKYYQQPRLVGTTLLLSAIPAILVGKLVGIRLITFLLSVFAIISFGFGALMTIGPYTWDEYKVRPAFAVAGIAVVVLVILSIILGMYEVVFIDR
jgi:hypothetical protein